MQSQRIAQQSHNANQRIYCRQKILCPTTMIIQVGTRVIVGGVCSYYHLHGVSYEIWKKENRYFTTELRKSIHACIRSHCAVSLRKCNKCASFFVTSIHCRQRKSHKPPVVSKSPPPQLTTEMFLWACQIIFSCAYGSLWYHCDWQGSFMSIISANAKTGGPGEHRAPLEQQKVFPVSPTTARILHPQKDLDY